MSYVNYAATNQIPVSLCIFIDVIIIIIIPDIERGFNHQLYYYYYILL